MTKKRICIAAGIALATASAVADVHKTFENPPEEAKLDIWYHWLGEYVTEEGIVRDMRTMGELGVGRAYVFCPTADGLPPPNARTMSAEWLRLFGVAIREARVNGLTLGFHNCPGWTSSGGPWITPENSMKCVVFSETDVDVGAAGGVSATLPTPTVRNGLYGDIATYAFPIVREAVLTGTPFPRDFAVKKTGTAEAVEFAYEKPFAPHYLLFRTEKPVMSADVELAAFVDGAWKKVSGGSYNYKNRTSDNRVLAIEMPAPAARYRLTVTSTPTEPWVRPADVRIEELRLSEMSHVCDLGRKNSSGEAYGYVKPTHPDEAGIDPSAIRDVTACLGSEGRFAAPQGTLAPGRWRIVRIGYTSTGKGPHPAWTGGLECDKLDRCGVEAHWLGMPAKVLALPGAKDVVKSVVIDSYEVGGQNWTGILPQEFEKRRGHAIGPNLLAVCGYTVGTAAQTADFLWDFQKTIGELFAENYYDRFAELCHEAGVECVFESYGGPFPSVRCAKNADMPSGEFWLGRPGHRSLDIMRQVAHDYGKRIIAAEAFTTEFQEGRFRATPRIFREAGESVGWINGVNKLVVHSYVHQPFVNVRPGLSMGRHGSQFGANTPWIREARAWSDYVRRGQALLQYGKPGFSDLDGIPEPVCPKGLRAIRREGENGERVYFVLNGRKEPFFGTVGLPAPAGSLPEIFDAVTGKVFPAPARIGKDLADVELDLQPGRGAFVVFSPNACRTGASPVPSRPSEALLADLSWDWTIVSFDGLAAPAAPMPMPTLVSWHRSADPALRHFAGRAVYEKTADIPEPCVLDLGDVRDVANVWLDGVKTACLWDAPYRVRVPAGRHVLRVEVVNAWPNRMIGDAIARRNGAAEEVDAKMRVPKWVAEGRADSGTGIFTWCNWPLAWSADDELLPAGLIGPVRLFRPAESVSPVEAELREKAAVRIAEIRNTPNMRVPAGAPTYYLSEKTGNDAGDGRSPATAWKTIARLNREELPAGSYVLFERGGLYRGSVTARPGVTYTAFGQGPKPRVYGSPADGAVPEKWERTENTNVWAYAIGHDDVGTLVFDGGAACAVKVLIRKDRSAGKTYNKTTGHPFASYRDLDTDLQFWHDYYPNGTGKVYLYSERNPGERFRSIEFNVKTTPFRAQRNPGVTVDNIDIRYAGSCGVSAGTCTNLTVRNCEFAWIGGSILIEDGFGRDHPTRLGNGVEIYGGCENYTVENCHFCQVYDAGMSPQYNVRKEDGMNCFDQKDIRFASNVIEKCFYSVEYFLTAADGNPSRMENFVIEDNLMFDAGFGFSEQRPDWGAAGHIRGTFHPQRNRAKGFVVRNNAFCRSKDDLVTIGNGLKNLDGSSSLPRLENNVFVGRRGGRLGVISETSGDVMPLGSETQAFLDGFGPGNRCVLTEPPACAAPVRTAELQAAIDRLAAAGGGTLTLTAGVYRTGALFFRPGVNLHLGKGARIVGVDDASGYPMCETRIEGETCRYYPALVNADRCDGFTVSGEGEIDGNGLPTWLDFWALRKAKPTCTNKELMRPRLFYVSNSKDVDVSGVTFKNAKFWTTHYYRCENLRVHDCRIVSETVGGVKGPSTDAIDLDNCRGVTISRVRMDVNDDGIAIKGGKGPWADDPVRCPGDGPTEGVTVEACEFGGNCHSALTFGSECPAATNVVMRNCRLERVGNVVNLKMRGDTPQRYHGIAVENVTGICRTVLNVHAWKQFFDLKDRKDVPKSYADDIRFRNCDFKCQHDRNITDSSDVEVWDVAFENVRTEGALAWPAGVDTPSKRRAALLAKWRPNGARFAQEDGLLCTPLTDGTGKMRLLENPTDRAVTEIYEGYVSVLDSESGSIRASDEACVKPGKELFVLGDAIWRCEDARK